MDDAVDIFIPIFSDTLVLSPVFPGLRYQSVSKRDRNRGGNTRRSQIWPCQSLKEFCFHSKTGILEKV